MVAFLDMTSALTIQKRAKIAARYEGRNFIVLVQRWWVVCKGRHYPLCPETIRGCRAKPMITGTENDKTRSGRPFTSQLAEVERRLEIAVCSLLSVSLASCFTIKLEMFMRSLHINLFVNVN